MMSCENWLIECDETCDPNTVESGYMQLLGNQKKVAYTRKLHISVGKTMLKDFLGAREKLHIYESCI